MNIHLLSASLGKSIHTSGPPRADSLPTLGITQAAQPHFSGSEANQPAQAKTTVNKLRDFGQRILQGAVTGLVNALNLRSLLWGGAMGALFGGIVALIPGGLAFSPVMIPIGMAIWAGTKFLIGFAAGAAIRPDTLRDTVIKNQEALKQGNIEQFQKDLKAALARAKK